MFSTTDADRWLLWAGITLSRILLPVLTARFDLRTTTTACLVFAAALYGVLGLVDGQARLIAVTLIAGTMIGPGA